MLRSYQRMGWQPDLAEMQPILRAHRLAEGTLDRGLPELPGPGETDEATAMALFWSALYEIALDRAARVDGLVVVSHEELAGGGMPAVRVLFSTLGLTTSDATAEEIEHERAPTTPEPSGTDQPVLHNFDRAPEQAAHSWRARSSAEEIALMETAAAGTMERLKGLRLRLQG